MSAETAQFPPGTRRDDSEALREALTAARAAGGKVSIRAGGTKDFYGRETPGARVIDPRGHRGIVGYEPSELVLTVRAGTALAEVNEALEARGQMLPFEPPGFGREATVGGTVACGLSGPRRPFAGACRDYVLGVRVLTGAGQILSFGGQVMKNVAGYDVSRLMVGALGTLGVLLEISFKVLPRPEVERTRVFECDPSAGLERLTALGRRALGLSAACQDDGLLRVRFSGNERGVRAACDAAGGDDDPDGAAYWERLREHELAFFDDARPLWRLAVPSAAPAGGRLAGEWLYDWAGAQRWLLSDEPAARIFEVARGLGGHAVRFRGGDRETFMAPLDAVQMRLHRQLRKAFDPGGLINPGRMYPDL